MEGFTRHVRRIQGDLKGFKHAFTEEIAEAISGLRSDRLFIHAVRDFPKSIGVDFHILPGVHGELAVDQANKKMKSLKKVGDFPLAEAPTYVLRDERAGRSAAQNEIGLLGRSPRGFRRHHGGPAAGAGRSAGSSRVAQLHSRLRYTGDLQNRMHCCTKSLANDRMHRCTKSLANDLR